MRLAKPMSQRPTEVDLYASETGQDRTGPLMLTRYFYSASGDSQTSPVLAPTLSYFSKAELSAMGGFFGIATSMVNDFFPNGEMLPRFFGQPDNFMSSAMSIVGRGTSWTGADSEIANVWPESGLNPGDSLHYRDYGATGLGGDTTVANYYGPNGDMTQIGAMQSNDYLINIDASGNEQLHGTGLSIGHAGSRTSQFQENMVNFSSYGLMSNDSFVSLAQKLWDTEAQVIPGMSAFSAATVVQGDLASGSALLLSGDHQVQMQLGNEGGDQNYLELDQANWTNFDNAPWGQRF